MAAATTHMSAQSFDEVVLPHLESAHRLARWLMRNEQDAEDVVQDASLRAFKYFGTFTGGDGRAWFLRIVRNACRSRYVRAPSAGLDPFDEERHTSTQALPDPEAQLLQRDGASRIKRAIADLPQRTREILVLREFEGLSYQEISETLSIPVGTVMSTLWRARRGLRASLTREIEGPAGINEARPEFNEHKEMIDATVHGRA